jgi:hypothetical protein
MRKFKPKPGAFKDNILRVAPDMLPKGSIKIESVTVEGKEYTDFDADNLTVNIPQAEDAWFNTCQILAGRDPAKALTELTAYLGKFADGGGTSENTKNNIPTAQYLLGTAFDRTGLSSCSRLHWLASSSSTLPRLLCASA